MKIISLADEEVIVSTPEIAKDVARILALNPTLQPSPTLLSRLTSNSVIAESDRLALFFRGSHETDSILAFNESLGGEFEKINDHSKRAKFADDPVMRKFLKKLSVSLFISSFSEKKGTLTVYHKSR